MPISHLRPPSVVYHGTPAQFNTFDHANNLGAHFGTREAALDRLRHTGHAMVDLVTYEDEEGQWWAIEEKTHTRPTAEHGPFANEDAAQAFIDTHGVCRKPLEFEIYLCRPLYMEDIGSWTFQAVTRFLRGEYSDIDDSEWDEAWNKSNESGWDAVKNSIQAAGYDCIVYTNQTEDVGSVSWIVWDNNLIHQDWRTRVANDPDCLNSNDYPPESP